MVLLSLWLGNGIGPIAAALVPSPLGVVAGYAPSPAEVRDGLLVAPQLKAEVLT